MATPASAQSTGVGYVYDPLGRLIAVYDSSSNAAVYQYDAVGNLLSITNYSFNQPSAFHLSSNSGQSGSTFTIYGTDFCSNPTVTIDGSAATVSSSSSTQIVVTVPSGASSGAVIVTCGLNQINAGNYIVGSSTAPTISGFTPSIGTAGTAVTINGGNFQTTAANNAVRFGINPTPPTSATTSSISAAVPSEASTGHISVTTVSGQATSSAYFYVPPAPASVSSLAVTGQMTIGGPSVNVSLTTGGTQALYAFEGTSGQQVSLNITNQSFNGNDNVTYYIIGPGGSSSNPLAKLLTWTSSNIITDVTLQVTGTYSVFVVPSGTNTGSVTLQLCSTPDVTGTISIGGSAVNVSIPTPGQDASLTFSGTAGQQISLNLTSQSFNGNDNVKYYIIPPNGSTATAIASLLSWTSGNIIADLTLPTTGIYTVFVDPAAGNTGSVTLQLFATADVTGTISIGGSPVNLTISTPGEDASLTFNGTTGQQISLNLTNENFNGNANVTYYIIPPGGSTANAVASLLTWTSSNILADVTLPSTGTYTLFVDPTGANTGSVTMQLFATADVTGTISIGGPTVNVTIPTPGQDASLTFSGTAGQQVGLAITNQSFNGNANVTYYILPPGGGTSSALGSVLSWTSTNFISSVALPTTGTYTVFVDPASSNTGSVMLQLANISDLSSTITVSDMYAQTILADAPQIYWRLDESGPPTAVNAAAAIIYGATGPTSPDSAVSLNGYSSFVSTAKHFNNPTPYSIEIWFKTTTGVGGRLIGFGNSVTGASSSYDRHLYMTNSGQLIFGQNAGSDKTVTSSSSYNDGSWHHAVGTYNGSTMVLYVDGSQVGSTSAGAPQNFSGYWRLGYDNLNGWPSAPTSYYFHGSLGEAAVYSTALSATQVSNHYSSAGGGSYDSTVLGDSPTSYWKLSESSGPTFADATSGGNTGTASGGSANALYQGTVTYSESGAISSDDAVLLDGSTGYATSLIPFVNPQALSVEVWFKTSTIHGGRLIGWGTGPFGNSTTTDRHIYMTNGGQIVFGTRDSADRTVQSTTAYNDGNWHQAVGTWANNTLSLYVDGALVGTATGGVTNNTGYWRLGDDNLSGWPSSPSSFYFAGTLDEAAVYGYALSSTQVANHYQASGR